jgi:hypothetical protein
MCSDNQNNTPALCNNLVFLVWVLCICYLLYYYIIIIIQLYYYYYAILLFVSYATLTTTQHTVRCEQFLYDYETVMLFLGNIYIFPLQSVDF